MFKFNSEAMNPEALSCGSPMPRGEPIAKPAEWVISLAGLLYSTPLVATAG